MKWEELNKILKSYSKLKISNNSVLLRLQQMERELQSPKGINYDGEVVSGGSRISRSERFAIKLDTEEEYERMIKKLDALELKIVNLINQIYTNNETCEPIEWDKLQTAEIILFNYYINDMSIFDLMVYMSYSKSQVLRYMKYGKKYLYENVVKNVDYKEFMKVDVENSNMTPNDTLQRDNIVS